MGLRVYGVCLSCQTRKRQAPKMDWTLFWTIVGAVGAVAGAIVVYVTARKPKDRDQAGTRPCSDRGRLQSAQTTIPTMMIFQNTRDEEVRVNWIDYAGNSQGRGNIPAKKT